MVLPQGETELDSRSWLEVERGEMTSLWHPWPDGPMPLIGWLLDLKLNNGLWKTTQQRKHAFTCRSADMQMLKCRDAAHLGTQTYTVTLIALEQTKSTSMHRMVRPAKGG